MSLNIGATVDRRYLLKREIARGGAGAVFEAEHLYTQRSVALKLLLPEQRRAPEPRARLLREALALSAARHSGVVAALDAGETEDGTPYLVLELLEGRSLEGILAVRRRIGAAEVAWLGARLCEALAAAHRRSIIHRDIKPSNVFVARDEQGSEVIKLFDFGVARMPSEQSKLTQDGALLGTPEYMAPEQLLARDVRRPHRSLRCRRHAVRVLGRRGAIRGELRRGAAQVVDRAAAAAPPKSAPARREGEQRSRVDRRRLLGFI